MNSIFGIVGVLAVIAVGGVIFRYILTDTKRGEKDPDHLPYQVKKYFFTRSEREFFHVLNDHIDKNKYTIFPKVRLADFIEVTERGKEYQGWLSKIKSKHVDFLVWNMQENKIACAIELDGTSHNSKKMQRRDAFVDKLYEKVGVQLEHIQVGSDFADVINKIKFL